MVITGFRIPRHNFSCLIFNASFLKEVSQKSFVFALQSFNFEGSFAKKFRFWSSKLQFWRKSRTKASFLSYTASFLKEVSQKSFVWQNNLNHTSVENQLTWTSNHLTAKLLESQINWQPTHLNLRSIDNQLTWIRNQLTNKINRIAHRLTTKSLESQIKWQPTLEFQIDWQPNHLNFKLIDNQINWISNQLTTTSLEVRINRQPKSFEAHIDWQPNHLTLNSLESDINWLSNQLSSTRPLPIGSLSLETSATALCGRYVIEYDWIRKPNRRKELDSVHCSHNLYFESHGERSSCFPIILASSALAFALSKRSTTWISQRITNIFRMNTWTVDWRLDWMAGGPRGHKHSEIFGELDPTPRDSTLLSEPIPGRKRRNWRTGNQILWPCDRS